jgi:fluoroacetyl-CoA thioesterase
MLEIGATREQSLLVGDSEAITFLGSAGPRVLSTPQMILWMEKTSRDLVHAMLEPGHDTVGTHVNVWHRKAAPMGAPVVFHARLTEVNKRRVSFAVRAMMGEAIIGEGTHERAIIEVNRFRAQVQSPEPPRL